VSVCAATKNLSDAGKMFSPAPIGQDFDTIAINKQHFLGRIHFFVIIFDVCVHFGVAAIMLLRPTNIFIYNLARDDLKMKAIELFLNLISLLKLFSRLNNLYFGSNT
jgi:ABC-type uncharacterized transport system permease subunit